jgi:peptide chain release factor subunit 1
LKPSAAPRLPPAPPAAEEGAAREVVARLARVRPGPFRVVSCYLKLEPRDKTRGKYLTKMKNRVRRALAALDRSALERATREQVARDLGRVLRFFEEPARLPRARGVALFACEPLALFEVLALPQVHRSRLAVHPVPLVRELVALEEEFGRVLVVLCDRRGARFFEVTAFDEAELPGLTQPARRTAKFHGSRQLMARAGHPPGGAGERRHHMRIRTEKQRLYAAAADYVFRLHGERPLAGIVAAGVGGEGAALLPHLHTYLHDLVLGVVKLNPKRVTAPEVREAALALREERERAWERAHSAAMRQGLATGWAVNGIAATTAALARGQVRTLLADGLADDPAIDDAVEDALAEHAQVDVLYDERARRAVDGLAALLRFRR